MPTFTFVDSEPISVNLQAFVAHLAAEDPEMAAILEAHLPLLESASSMDRLPRKVLEAFNQQVEIALDQRLLNDLVSGSRTQDSRQ